MSYKDCLRCHVTAALTLPWPGCWLGCLCHSGVQQAAGLWPHLSAQSPWSIDSIMPGISVLSAATAQQVGMTNLLLVSTVPASEVGAAVVHMHGASAACLALMCACFFWVSCLLPDSASMQYLCSTCLCSCMVWCGMQRLHRVLPRAASLFLALTHCDVSGYPGVVAVLQALMRASFCGFEQKYITHLPLCSAVLVLGQEPSIAPGHMPAGSVSRAACMGSLNRNLREVVVLFWQHALTCLFGWCPLVSALARLACSFTNRQQGRSPLKPGASSACAVQHSWCMLASDRVHDCSGVPCPLLAMQRAPLKRSCLLLRHPWGIQAPRAVHHMPVGAL